MSVGLRVTVALVELLQSPFPFTLASWTVLSSIAYPLGALLFAGSDPYAACTIVNGRVRVRDGRMTDVDEAAALDGANAAATRLLDAARRRTGIDFARQA